MQVTLCTKGLHEGIRGKQSLGEKKYHKSRDLAFEVLKVEC